VTPAALTGQLLLNALLVVEPIAMVSFLVLTMRKSNTQQQIGSRHETGHTKIV
jgi:hypothetical protein